MFYAISDASYPLQFLSVGNLVNENKFLHPRRTLDSYEFISVIQGCLHIQTGNRSYDVCPGDFLMLYPGQCHYGCSPTDGPLSFYWTHFYFTGPRAVVREEADAAELLSFCHVSPGDISHYILPEYGKLSLNCRTNVLFVQLLDLSRRVGFAASRQCSYAASTLMLELTNECFLPHMLVSRHGTLPANAAAVAEWLQLNYDTRLSVNEIAERFGYHPSYLAAFFKQATQMTVTEYLNRQRIHAAENLLGITPPMSLADISEQVGFSDEKYFMKLFKRYKGLTPTSYRRAFSEKQKNRI